MKLKSDEFEHFERFLSTEQGVVLEKNVHYEVTVKGNILFVQDRIEGLASAFEYAWDEQQGNLDMERAGDNW